MYLTDLSIQKLKFVDQCNIFSKDYFCQKIITSASIVFEDQFNNFLISWKRHIPFLRDSIFYILKPCINLKVATSWIGLDSKVENIFEYIFWIENSLLMKLNQ